MTSPHLKIGLVLDDSLDSSDGVQQYILTLGGWLQSQGHEVHYLVGETKRTDLKNVHSLARNWRVRYNGNTLSIPLPASKRRLKRLLRQHVFDVLHVQAPYSPMLAGRLLKLAWPETAVIGTFHVLPYDPLANWSNRLLALLNHRTARRFDTMISNSQPTHDFAARVYKFSSRVIPNPFPMRDFMNVNIKPKDDSPTIVFLGRLVPRKGGLQLLQAVARLRSEGLFTQPFRVVMGGKGVLRKQLEEYVQAHGLSDLVSFAGYVAEEEKAKFLSEADIAIFPSTSGESFGISLLEAMAASRGVVLGGDNPGYRAVLMPLGEEHLVNPKDTTALAGVLAYWLGGDVARKVAQQAQKTYVEQFDIERVGRDIVKTYNEALRTRRNVR